MTHSLQDPGSPITCANYPCERTTLDPDHDGWTCETCPQCTREINAQHAADEKADAEMRRDKTE